MASKPKTKVSIVNLPHDMDEDEFRSLIYSFIKHISWMSFCHGKKKSKTGEHVQSRAHVNFKESRDAIEFVDFLSSCELEQKPIAEYAIYQKEPHRAPKQDNLRGTIETDEDYQHFVEQLNAPSKPPLSMEERNALIDERDSKTKPFHMVPILEAVKQKSLQKSKSRPPAATKVMQKPKGPKPEKPKRRRRKGGRGRRKKKGEQPGPAYGSHRILQVALDSANK